MTPHGCSASQRWMSCVQRRLWRRFWVWTPPACVCRLSVVMQVSPSCRFCLRWGQQEVVADAFLTMTVCMLLLLSRCHKQSGLVCLTCQPSTANSGNCSFSLSASGLPVCI